MSDGSSLTSISWVRIWGLCPIRRGARSTETWWSSCGWSSAAFRYLDTGRSVWWEVWKCVGVGILVNTSNARILVDTFDWQLPTWTVVFTVSVTSEEVTTIFRSLQISFLLFSLSKFFFFNSKIVCIFTVFVLEIQTNAKNTCYWFRFCLTNRKVWGSSTRGTTIKIKLLLLLLLF